MGKIKICSGPMGTQIFARLILGTATLGMDYGATNKKGQISCEEFKQILQRCRSTGIRCLDTAQAYGKAEQILGYLGTPGFSITTKVSLNKNENAKSVLKKARISLQDLRVAKLRGCLLHNEQRLLSADGKTVASAFQDLKTRGIAEKVGISSYDPAQALELCKIHKFDLVQLPINVLDARIFQNDLIKKFIDNGIEVHARSVFLQGALLGMPKESTLLPKKVLEETALFRGKCRKQKLDPLEAAIAFVLGASPNIKAIFGVTGQDELEALSRAAPVAQILKNYKPPAWSPEFDPRTWKK